MTRLGLVAVLALAPLPALAASASGAASATVVSPIAVRQISDLDFGVIAANGAAAGTVTIPPGGTADYAGGARDACASPSTCAVPHFAQFEVSGEANRAYTISAPTTIWVAGQSLGTAASPVLLVDAFTFRSVSRPGEGAAGKLDHAGADRFDLGATLRVPAATPPAHFRLSLEVVVTYG